MDSVNPSRRKVLKSIGVTSLAGVPATSASGSKSLNNPNIEVREAKPSERRSAIKEALHHNGFRLLVSEFRSLGYHPRNHEADVVHVTEENGEERYVVQLPFQKKEREGQRKKDEENHVFIQHNGLENISINSDIRDSSNIIGSIIAEQERSNEESSRLHSTRSFSKEVYIESFTVSEGKVHTSVDTLKKDEILGQWSFSAQNEDLDPGGGGGCSTCMIHTATHCEDVNWGCVALNAGMFIATAASCAACAGTAGWGVPACGVCVGQVLATGGSFAVCDMGG